MNKQLQRDLQSTIQSLKAPQLANVLAHYEQLSQALCQKSITKKGMNYQCEIGWRSQTTRGYGRSEEEAVSNATKNLLSGLVGRNVDVNRITGALKYKNGGDVGDSRGREQRYKYLSSQKQRNKQPKQPSIFIDDISMIQANSRIDLLFQSSTDTNPNQGVKRPQQGKPQPSQHCQAYNHPEQQTTPQTHTQKQQNKCGCLYYQMHQYQNNEIKHLQARINLLTEENMLLKKMLLCGGVGGSKDLQRCGNGKKVDSKEKQNSFCHANTILQGKIR